MTDKAVVTRWLLVRIADKRYAMPAESVWAVLPARHPSPLPLGSDALSGITLFRGRVIPVVDARPILGIPVESETLGAIVVLGLATGVGLLVTEVLGMVATQSGSEIRWGRKPVDRLDPAQLIREELIRLPDDEQLKGAVLQAEEGLETEESLEGDPSRRG